MQKLFRISITTLVMLTLILQAGITAADGPIDPPSVEGELYPGDSIEITKTVTNPEIPPVVDVVISVDLTISMSAALTALKGEISSVINALSSASGDLQVGIVSHEDYVGFFDSRPACDYWMPYGANFKPDVPIRVDQAVSPDFAAADAAVQAMSLGTGSDGPESYARVIYEAGRDAQGDLVPGIGYRADAQKILVMFVDNVPHDCDLLDGGTAPGLIPYQTITGIDPGRNATIDFGGDDIDFQDDAMQAIIDGDVTLLVVDSSIVPEARLPWWNFYTNQTGGSAVGINPDGTVPGGISLTDLIFDLISDVETDIWWDAACDAGISANLVPEKYLGVSGGTALEFIETISVSNETAPGEYQCNVTFYANSYPDNGVVIGEEELKITVLPIPVPIDIKPTSCLNPLNVKAKGVIPVAILGTADLDVSQVDPTTVQLEGVSPLRWNWEDIATPYEPYLGKVGAFDCTDEGSDGYMDLTLKFDAREIIAALGEVNDGDVIQLQLTGNLLDGRAIIGEDVVVILEKGK